MSENKLNPASGAERIADSLQRGVKRGRVEWRRADVEQAITEAESDARRTKRTHYVAAIGFPDGSQIYGEGTMGVTDDYKLATGLGTLFATCEPTKTTRHA